LIQINAALPPAPQLAAFKSEDDIVTNEFYYLALVLGCFAAFTVSVGMSMIRYRAWVRKTGHRIQSAE
jgi:hypothetical protein